MGIYIHGMEMPKEQNVPTWAVIFSNGEVRIYKDGFNTDQGNGKGTAIPIPPHGRLIDADAMIHDIEKAITPSWYIKERNADMVKFLSLEDTIIPAREEGET